MGIVSRTIGDILNGPDKPIFSSARCINRRQLSVPCSLCVDVCPKEVFSLKSNEPIKWDQCNNCGLCISVCPSRCFAPGADMQKQYSEGFNLSAPVSFGCFRDAGISCTKRAECLASIPWELAAVLSLYTHVVFYVGACGSCPHEKRVTCLRNNLTLLREFLGPEQFAARVHLLNQGTLTLPDEKKEVSRRDLLAGIGLSAGKTAARSVLQLLPVIEDNSEADGTLYRQLLANTVYKIYQDSLRQKQAQETRANSLSQPAAGTGTAHDTSTPAPAIPKYGVRVPRFTTACYGCGICERICPHKALEISEEKDGKRTISITPWRCTGCGLCASLCPHGGLNGLHVVQVPHMNRLPLVRIASATCSKCGMAMKPADVKDPDTPLCALCARKRRR